MTYSFLLFRKILLTATLLVNIPVIFQSKAADTKTLPVITYRQIDSISQDGDNNVFLLWATWCGPCWKKVAHLLAIAKQRPTVIFHIIVDPDSKDAGVYRKFPVPEPNVVFYKVENVRPPQASLRNVVKVNDMQQVRLFNSNLMRRSDTALSEMRFPVAYVFNHAGRLVFTTIVLNDFQSAIDSAIAKLP